MKKLLILSGKGGTGKTTTAAAFIDFLNANSYADCDVDAPNLHLIHALNEEPKKSDYYGSQKAWINSELCRGCGRCFRSCRFNAIKKDDFTYKVDEFNCEGCGVCAMVCPVNAVSMVDDVSGELMLYENNKVFSTAKLKMGRGNSGKLVSEVKKQLINNKINDTDISIIDGSPGIGCPVIASISGVDMVLIVAEPSLSGISDMKRIVDTSRVFNVKIAVCINKYDTCIENSNKIEDFCNENNIDFVGKVPYDSNVSTLINRGQSIANSDCPANHSLFEVFQNTMIILNKI